VVFGVFAFFSFVASIIFSEPRIFLWGCFGTAAILSFLRALMFLSLMDFHYYYDYDKAKQDIDRHNDNIDTRFKRL
jgi:hypothetical protein